MDNFLFSDVCAMAHCWGITINGVYLFFVCVHILCAKANATLCHRQSCHGVQITLIHSVHILCASNNIQTSVIAYLQEGHGELEPVPAHFTPCIAHNPITGLLVRQKNIPSHIVTCLGGSWSNHKNPMQARGKHANSHTGKVGPRIGTPKPQNVRQTCQPLVHRAAFQKWSPSVLTKLQFCPKMGDHILQDIG